MRKILSILILATFILPFNCFAKEEVTIIISGQSHASLYPCACPVSPSGGVSRRATAIKNIEKDTKNIIKLESGASFAGGNYDTNLQTTELDKERTRIYMESLVKMGYDAFLISNEELNFGQDFLDEIISKYKLSYLSANVKQGNLLPYTIKQVGNMNLAIIGISDEKVKTKTKADYTDPKIELQKLLDELSKVKKVDAVIVLSYLDEKESERIIHDLPGIDIWISSNNPFRPPVNKKINNTTLIIPGWEVRTLTKLQLTFEENNKEFKIENIELNNDIANDVEIDEILPQCFKDEDCKKPGHTSQCKNPATKKAQCEFTEIKPVKLSIIKPKECKTCDIDSTVERIKKILPNLKIEYVLEDSKQAKKMIKDLTIKMLPAYLLDSSIEKEEVFSQIKQVAKKVGNYYMFEPGFSGVSYFANREKKPNRLDVFFDIGTKDIVEILNTLRVLQEKRPNTEIYLNFLAIEDEKEGFIAKGGKYEVEEYLRSACISKYYSDKLQYYLSCRLSNIESSWWDDCVVKFGMDPALIKGCAQTEEGAGLLRGLIALTQELEVVFGPTFVINNQEIFSSDGAPSLEQLEKLFEK